MDDLIQENDHITTKENVKKSKKAKKKAGDWEDDVAKELEDMTLEEEGGPKSEEPHNTPQEKKKKEKVRQYNLYSSYENLSSVGCS